MTILVFPSCLDDSLTFLDEAKRWDKSVIGASSIDDDPNKKSYTIWEKLPYIHENHFIEALVLLIKKYNISAIFSTHVLIQDYLARLSTELPPFQGLHLLSQNPHIAAVNRLQRAYAKAEEAIPQITRLLERPTDLRTDFIAALIAEATSFYGQCSFEKIIGLCAALSDAPKGDVIEIGTLYGKSAYVLNRLADHFTLGTTLAIDPWRAENCVQTESPIVLQQLSDQWDWEKVFQGFVLNMQARCAVPFNYIRASSTQAWQDYCSKQEITTPQFGSTHLSKKIAVLHIDGNHDEKSVLMDFELWSQFLVPGSWVVFDDYEWAHGIGPRKAVDKIKSLWKTQIERFFVIGKAAFIKINASIHP